MTTAVAAPSMGTFASLEFRNFRLFFSGQLVSQIGTWMTQIGLTLLVLHITDSGLAVGALTACQFGPILVLGAWAGVIADRSNKPRLLMTMQTVTMIQSLVLAALAFSGEPPLPLLYFVAMLGGVATAFDSPVRRSFVTEMVPESHLRNAVSLNSAVMTGSRIVGPALAGVVISTLGFGWCFLLDGISYVFVLTGLALIRTADLHPTPMLPRQKGQVMAGIRYARSVPDLWVPMVMLMIAGSLSFNFQVTVPLLARNTFDGSDTMFTLMSSVLSVGSLSGALFTARRAALRLHEVVLSAALFGIALTALALAPNVITAFAAMLFTGFASLVYISNSTAIIQLRADPQMRGRMLALQTIVFIGSTPIGGPFIGAVCQYIDPRAGVAIGAAAAFVATLYGRSAERRVSAPRAANQPLTTCPANTGG